MKKFLGLIAGVLLAGPMVANADPTTYMYVSPNFSIVQPLVPAGVTNITAIFTVDLQPNLTNSYLPVSSWSVSDGATTITSSTASPNYQLTSHYWTDALGEITIMSLSVLWVAPFGTIPVGATSINMTFLYNPVDNQFPAFSLYCVTQIAGQCDTDVARADGEGVLSIVGGTNPGSVPEPATLALVGLGLAGIRFARRKRAA